MRSPKAKREARQARARARAEGGKLAPADQLRALELRGHGHCAEAEHLRTIVMTPEIRDLLGNGLLARRALERGAQ